VSPLLDVRDLTIAFPQSRGGQAFSSIGRGQTAAAKAIAAVRGLSFSIDPGEVLGLVGESGSGKSITSLAIMGLLPPAAVVSGDITFQMSSQIGDKPVHLTTLPAEQLRQLRGSRIAMIFQEPMTALNPVMRVGAQIAEAILAHHPGLSREEVDRRVALALERAVVPEPAMRARQFPHQLSGGLRQRAMIAMALAGHDGAPGSASTNGASEPRLLIADEPTTALDVTVQKQILELLARLRRELGLALLFITHDLGVVAQVADRIAVTYAGQIVEEGPALEVLARPRHPYTAGLLRASPQLVRHKLEPIPGTVPALTALPPGCAFEPRCPVRIAECTVAMPELRSAGPNHSARCILVAESGSK
jgi:oligopeptide/dipeptide ABC transporter ATP-binding protein